MGVTAFPFETQDTSEGQYGRIFQEVQDAGVVGRPGDTAGMVVPPGLGLVLTVTPAAVWATGRVADITGPDSERRVTIPTADPSQSRVDRVVLTFDAVGNDAGLQVRTGTPGSTTPGALVRDLSGEWDVPLARVTVGAGTVNIGTGDVVDERPWLSTRVRLWTTATRPNPPRWGDFGMNLTRAGVGGALGAPEWWNGERWAALGDATLGHTQGTITGTANTLPSASWVELGRVEGITYGGLVKVTASVLFTNLNSGSIRQAQFRVLQDGADIGGPGAIDIPWVTGRSDVSAPMSWEWHNEAAPGPHAWVLQGNASAAGAIRASRWSMSVLERP